MASDAWAQPSEIATIVGSVLAVGALLLGIIRLWFRDVLREMRPNGGQTSSNGDTTKRAEDAACRAASAAEETKEAVVGLGARLDSLDGWVSAIDTRTRQDRDTLQRHLGAHQKVN